MIEMKRGPVCVPERFRIGFSTAYPILSPVSVAGKVALTEHLHRILYGKPEKSLACERVGGDGGCAGNGPHGEKSHIEKDGNGKHGVAVRPFEIHAVPSYRVGEKHFCSVDAPFAVLPLFRDKSYRQHGTHPVRLVVVQLRQVSVFEIVGGSARLCQHIIMQHSLDIFPHRSRLAEQSERG